jgi:hypothetical protein
MQQLHGDEIQFERIRHPEDLLRRVPPARKKLRFHEKVLRVAGGRARKILL